MTNEYNPDGKEIRFIDSHYKDLFHIPDGSCVQIHYPDEMVVKPCTFIDEYHTQIGYNVFHICQFAEIMERNGAIDCCFLCGHLCAGNYKQEIRNP